MGKQYRSMARKQMEEIKPLIEEYEELLQWWEERKKQNDIKRNLKNNRISNSIHDSIRNRLSR